MPTAIEYGERALHYLDNARALLASNEIEKAGECVWGAMAQVLKAVPAGGGSSIRSHEQLRNYARSLAVEMAEPGRFSFQDFLAAQQMHTNFYEAGLRKEDVQTVLERTAAVIDNLLQLRALRA